MKKKYIAARKNSKSQYIDQIFNARTDCEGCGTKFERKSINMQTIFGKKAKKTRHKGAEKQKI